jgi:benzodiazapine receptor
MFLLLNFGGLALGGLFTSTGVSSEWYWELQQAPWTPPGWVFGAAWTTIMICFSIYMALLWKATAKSKRLQTLYFSQWVLNVGWNIVFFYYHQIFLGLLVISGLTVIIGYFLFRYKAELKFKSVFILPYFLWLLIATSLNAYIYFNN